MHANTHQYAIIIAADKNPNHYVMSAKEADKMLHTHITKIYKLAPENAPNDVTKEAKRIATELDIAERVPVTVEREAFGTLKDHKENTQQKKSLHGKKFILKLWKSTLAKLVLFRSNVWI